MGPQESVQYGGARMTSTCLIFPSRHFIFLCCAGTLNKNIQSAPLSMLLTFSDLMLKEFSFIYDVKKKNSAKQLSTPLSTDTYNFTLMRAVYQDILRAPQNHTTSRHKLMENTTLYILEKFLFSLPTSPSTCY